MIRPPSSPSPAVSPPRFSLAKPFAPRCGVTAIASVSAPAWWSAMSSPSTTATPRLSRDLRGPRPRCVPAVSICRSRRSRQRGARHEARHDQQGLAMTSTPPHSETDLAPIREAVRALCADFSGEYWRQLDRERAYPAAFVSALTKAGFLVALIPAQYGGSGLTMTAAAAIMEEIQASGCNGAPCHAQMYTMGTLLRHGSAAQKERYLPGIARGDLRLQAFGVTEPTSGTDTLSLRTTAVRDGDHYVINGQKIGTSRAEHSDLMLLLARHTPRAQAGKRTAGLSVFIVDMRAALGHGLTIR